MTLETHPKDISEWINKNILEIMVENWPNLCENVKLENTYLCDAEGNKVEINDHALSELTLNGVSTLINVGNAAYFPNLGVTSSGDSAWAVLQSDKLRNLAEWAQLTFEKNEEQFYEEFAWQLSQLHMRVPERFDIHFMYVPKMKRFVVMDLVSTIFWDFTEGKSDVLFPKKWDTTLLEI